MCIRFTYLKIYLSMRWWPIWFKQPVWIEAIRGVILCSDRQPFIQVGLRHCVRTSLSSCQPINSLLDCHMVKMHKAWRPDRIQCFLTFEAPATKNRSTDSCFFFCTSSFIVSNARTAAWNVHNYYIWNLLSSYHIYCK